MITLGVIESLDNLNNFCKVRLPTFEGAGNKTEVVLSATQMLPPGIDAGYEVGDVVFVSFVDNTLGRPVVLGQLYKGPGKGTKIDTIGSVEDVSLGEATSMTCKQLNVSSGATIPKGTQISGDNIPEAYKTINGLIQGIRKLQDEIAELKTLLAAVASAGALSPTSGFATLALGLGLDAIMSDKE